MKSTLFFLSFCFLSFSALCQSPEALLAEVKTRLDRVNDYEAKGKMKTNVVFIKAPIASVSVYYKKPNKLRVKNQSGVSFIPKGSININLAGLFANTAEMDVIDLGKDGSGLRMLKLLPRDENADVVLSTLYIDETKKLVKKAKTTTKENGTYELDMTYGKYADYGLADKVVFTFNTKDYKLPKGVTFDYDDGTGKNGNKPKTPQKGKVELTYTSYIINKGISDEVFK